jgi:hypothetical protein
MLELIIECMLAWRNGRALPPYFGRDLLAPAYDDQRFISWGCFLEGSMAKSWLPIQAAHLRSQGSRKTAKTWATGLVRQLWKVAFKMWQHPNTWQHDGSNPEYLRQHAKLDQQVAAAWSQGTALVLKEHTYLFTLPLSDRQKHTLTEKVDWLVFVSLAQRRALASLCRQHKTRRKFRAWARSGLPDTPPPVPPAGLNKRKRSHSRSTSARSLRRHANFAATPSPAHAAPILAPSSVTPRKRKRPPD